MELLPQADLCAGAKRGKNTNSRMQEIREVLGSTKFPEALNDLPKEILQDKLSPEVIYKTV